jgi:hypothetical protein
MLGVSAFLGIDHSNSDSKIHFTSHNHVNKKKKSQ